MTVVLGSVPWYCLLSKLFAGLTHGVHQGCTLRPNTPSWVSRCCGCASCRSTGLSFPVLWDRKCPSCSLGSPVTPHHIHWHVFSRCESSSLPALGDLLCYQDSSQSHHQGTLAYLLSVMTPHVFQLHCLAPPIRNSNPLWCLAFECLQSMGSTALREGLPGIQKMEKCFSGKYKMQLLLDKYINKEGEIPSKPAGTRTTKKPSGTATGATFFPACLSNLCGC